MQFERFIQTVIHFDHSCKIQYSYNSWSYFHRNKLTMNRLTNLLIQFGGFQTTAMAIYHFFIPYQFSWSDYITEYSPTINWALYSINNYFSFTLLVLGFALLYFIKKKSSDLNILRLLILINLLFWGFSFIYQIIEPMPLPDRLDWLRILLPSIALLNTMVFAFTFMKIRNEINLNNA